MSAVSGLDDFFFDAEVPAVRASKRVRRMTSVDSTLTATAAAEATAAPVQNNSKKKSKDNNNNSKNKPISKIASGDTFSAESSVPSITNATTNPTIAVFLQKTFAMVNDCDSKICSWSNDGDSFIVKDPEKFEGEIIPNYFGHSKLSSFARQLNFYGFHKVQSKPIRNIEADPETSKYLIFANENFKRNRPDLLTRIQRSTRGGHGNNDQDKEVENLKRKVSMLEEIIQQISGDFNRRIQALETSTGISTSTTKTNNNTTTKKPLSHGSSSRTGTTSNKRAAHAFTSMDNGSIHNAVNSNVNTSGYPRSPFPNVDMPLITQPLSRPKTVMPSQSMNTSSFHGSMTLPTSSSINPLMISSSIPSNSAIMTNSSSTTTLPPHPKQKFDLDDQMLKEISLLRGVSTLGGLRGLSIESLPLGLDDASQHNWNNPLSFQSSSNNIANMPSSFHTSPSASINRNTLIRDQSAFSLSLDLPLPDDDS